MSKATFPALAVWLVCCPWAAAGESSPSFRHDVSAVLSRAGCNSGACHGNLNGKGGLKLSLRGFDPAFDLSALTRDMLARRVDWAHPDESLVLQKATGRVPHEGGIRFASDSVEYRAVRNWIAVGCPNDLSSAPALLKLEVENPTRVLVDPVSQTTITARATFTDGTVRDVTTLAAFDTNNVGVARISPDGVVTRLMPGEVVVSVRYLDRQAPVRIAFVPNRPIPTFSDVSHPLDQKAYEQFTALRLRPSERSTDEMFLRRVYLDALGLIPSVDEAKAFLRDRDPDKRTKLIDALLARPEFAEHWTQIWSDLLRNEEKSLDQKGTHVFHAWMKAWFDADRPLNEFARTILAGRGSTYETPGSNFYRAIRDPYSRAESVAQVFLGVRISCARCHNHPFDIWTQDDYHRFAAVFAGVDYRVRTNNRKDNLDKHEFIGEQIVFSNRQAKLNHPRGGTAEPKLLGAVAVPGDSLGRFADWVADAHNPFFARAQANRVWLHLTGRGLVDPNDDFRDTNPASHPAVLNHLADVFAANGFRLKPLVRHIMTSQTYQISSTPNETNAGDDVYHSKAAIAPLKAESLMDALSRGLDASFQYTGYPAGTRAGQIVAMPQTGRRFAKSNGDAERFMRTFGKPERLLTCECERSEDAGMMQAFSLMTGDVVNGLIKQDSNRIGKLLASKAAPAEILNELYLGILTRYPSSKEATSLLNYVAAQPNPRAAWEDVAWSLVNSKEFLLRR
ncbi:MAG: DUF1549 and DUF1553 domain-containing protein [Gemmataceae bacterium]